MDFYGIHGFFIQLNWSWRPLWFTNSAEHERQMKLKAKTAMCVTIYVYIYIIHDINIMQYYILYIQVYVYIYSIRYGVELRVPNTGWSTTKSVGDHSFPTKSLNTHFTYPIKKIQLLLVRSPILVVDGGFTFVFRTDLAGCKDLCCHTLEARRSKCWVVIFQIISHTHVSTIFYNNIWEYNYNDL